MAYANPAVRPSSDIDLLIRRADFPRALDALAAAGFRPSSMPSERHRALYPATRNTLMFVHPKRRCPIDLHWNLLPVFFGVPLNFDEFRSRAVSMETSQGPVPALCAEDHLLAVAVKGTVTRWTRAAPVFDLASLVRLCGAEGSQRALKRAARMGIRRMIAIGLHIGARLFGSWMTASCCGGKRCPGAVVRTADEVMLRWRNARPPSRMWRDSAIEFLAPLILQSFDRRPDRIRHVLKVFAEALRPTEEDWNAVSSEMPVQLLYVPVRIGRLSFKFGRRLLSDGMFTVRQS
jgi:hypothetical protein